MGSYKALYRKYRPTSFNTVVGQEYIIRTLKNSISKDHISHAYLFTGPRGVGKTTVARIFAKAINCTNRINDEACEECEVCKQTNSNSNPDIIEINASNQTGVNDMRDLLDKVVFLPTISKYKVYIIDEVHMLSSSSFNALLKTLEEPPKHAIFILCTTEVEKVIPTIRSRCQRYDFHLIDKDVIIDRLDYVRREENINITRDALSLIADASEGGMRDALSLLDQVSSFSISDEITKDDVISVSGMLDFDSLKDIAVSVLNNESTKSTIILDDLIKSGKEVEKITSNLINFFKDILIIKNTNRSLDKVGYNSAEFLELLTKFNNKELFNYIDILSDASRDYRYSLDKRLYLELALIKMCDNSEPQIVSEQKAVQNASSQSTKTEYNPNITYSFKKEEPVIEEKKEIVEPIIETPIIKEEEKPSLESREQKFFDMFNEAKAEEEENVVTLDGENTNDDPFMALFNNVNEDKDEIIEDHQDNKVEDSHLNEAQESFNLFDEPKDEEKPVIEPLKEEKEEPNLFSFSFDQEKPAKTASIEPTFNNQIQKEDEQPVVQPLVEEKETIEDEELAIEEPKSEYNIHFIEKVLNNADKSFKEKTIVSLERAIRESKGTDLYKYALLLDGVTISASSREAMILVFNEVGHCNLIMKEENIEGVKEFFQRYLNLYISFMAIPFDYWNKVSTEFVTKFKANKERNLNNYITLSEIECPGLNINTKDTKKEKEDKFKDLEDIFSGIIE